MRAWTLKAVARRPSRCERTMIVGIIIEGPDGNLDAVSLSITVISTSSDTEAAAEDMLDPFPHSSPPA